MNDPMGELADKHREEILAEFPEAAERMFAAHVVIVGIISRLTKEQSAMLLRQLQESNELA